jgi:predicted chitinase
LIHRLSLSLTLENTSKRFWRNAPFIRARFYQGRLGVLIFTEQDGFTENL